MHYLNNPAEGSNPLISLVNANLSGLPATTIINAEIDPLQTEGGMLADKLRAANVPVVRQVYTGVTHEFFGMATVIPEARDAQAFAAQRLRDALK
jgi:acetyl esterase/lipase